MNGEQERAIRNPDLPGSEKEDVLEREERERVTQGRGRFSEKWSEPVEGLL
jgi:hypothetical protein